jgi:hypothetical protein
MIGVLVITKYKGIVDRLQDWKNKKLCLWEHLVILLQERVPKISLKAFMPPHGIRKNILLWWDTILQHLGSG